MRIPEEASRSLRGGQSEKTEKEPSVQQVKERRKIKKNRKKIKKRERTVEHKLERLERGDWKGGADTRSAARPRQSLPSSPLLSCIYTSCVHTYVYRSVGTYI